MVEPVTDENIHEVLLRYLVPIEDLRGLGNKLARRLPAPDSLAAADAAARTVGEPAYALANHAWTTGSEHALMWSLLTQAGVHPASSHGVLARATLEGTAICRWLIDPGCDPDERRERADVVQLENARQQVNFLAVFGGDDAETQAQRQRAAKQQQKIKAAIAPKLRDSKGPNITELFRDYVQPVGTKGDGEWLYRALSAAVHGHQWGMGMNKVVEIAEIDDEMSYVEMHMNPVVAQALAMTVNTNLVVALRELALYMGITD